MARSSSLQLEGTAQHAHALALGHALHIIGHPQSMLTSNTCHVLTPHPWQFQLIQNCSGQHVHAPWPAVDSMHCPESAAGSLLGKRLKENMERHDRKPIKSARRQYISSCKCLNADGLSEHKEMQTGKGIDASNGWAVSEHRALRMRQATEHHTCKAANMEHSQATENLIQHA